MNPVEEVAGVYREALESWEADFDCVAFALFYPGYGPDNYTVFKEVFDRAHEVDADTR